MLTAMSNLIREEERERRKEERKEKKGGKEEEKQNLDCSFDIRMDMIRL